MRLASQGCRDPQDGRAQVVDVVSEASRTSAALRRGERLAEVQIGTAAMVSSENDAFRKDMLPSRFVLVRRATTNRFNQRVTVDKQLADRQRACDRGNDRCGSGGQRRPPCGTLASMRAGCREGNETFTELLHGGPVSAWTQDVNCHVIGGFIPGGRPLR